MEFRLTDEADYLLCILYDAYRTRIKNGTPPSDAKFFGGAESIQSNFCQNWSTYEIDEAARELSLAGLVQCVFADNTFAVLVLNRIAISSMQHRFSDKAGQLLSRISELRQLLLG